MTAPWRRSTPAGPQPAGCQAPTVAAAVGALGSAEGSQPSEAAIVARGLSKSFGRRRAVRSASLCLLPGERLAVMGPNGAGKTTLIRLLATLLRPSTGTLAICGIDTGETILEARRRIGTVLHETLLYPDLTLAENLRFFARLYDVANAEIAIDNLSGRLALRGLLSLRVRRLSRGQQQRASLARALLHDPTVLLFDEPDTGLDSSAFELVRYELLRDPGRAIILTTHSIAHARALTQRIALMHDGRLREIGRLDMISDAAVQSALSTKPGPVLPTG